MNARALRAGLLLLATSGPARAQQPAGVAVGSASARPGERASGYIEVPAGVDSATRIPVTVVNGARSGPTLALIAGTHGSEVAPIIALQRVREQLDPARLSGIVIIVHIANPPSFYGRTIYYSPVDGKNLNRVYPGRPNGTVSERIADAITREVIARADYLMDMHAGDGNESLRPYAYWMPIGLDARVDSVSGEMTIAFGNEFVVVDTTRPRDPAASAYTSNTAMTRGRPAITTENGAVGMPVEEMVRRNVTGALRVMRYLHMVPGAPSMTPRPVFLRRTEVLRSSMTGVWHPLVARDQRVPQGALLGYLTDAFGDGRADVRAPFAGRMLYVVATPATTRGEPLGMIGAPR